MESDIKGSIEDSGFYTSIKSDIGIENRKISEEEKTRRQIEKKCVNKERPERNILQSTHMPTQYLSFFMIWMMIFWIPNLKAQDSWEPPWCSTIHTS
jgi:hypothetical protein